MQRLIHTIALAAALITVVVSVWRDYSLLISLKRVVISYLALFFAASIIVLACKVIFVLSDEPSEEKIDLEPPAENASAE